MAKKKLDNGSCVTLAMHFSFLITHHCELISPCLCVSISKEEPLHLMEKGIIENKRRSAAPCAL
jgi:hypothetical protein